MRTAFAVLTTLLLLLALLVSTTANALSDPAIRCKVCERAIGYVWHQGVDLRSHCKGFGDDPRCDHTNLHQFGIEEMVHEVCDKLPKTHKALEESEFDLILHEDPQHPQHVHDAIYKSCIKWVHEEHGLDQVALYLYANLDAGKSTGQILHALQHRFCGNTACNADYKGRRRDYHDTLGGGADGGEGEL